MIAAMCLFVPISVKGETSAEQVHQENQKENYAGKKNRKNKNKKARRNAYISGFFAASSLISLVGIITAEAFSDVSVTTIDSEDPVLVDKVNDFTFANYEDLLGDYDEHYNRLSSNCRWLDRGLDDLSEKYEDVESIDLDIKDFRETQLNYQCGNLIAEKNAIDLTEEPYTKSELHAHLDSFAIQLIALSSVFIVSSSFLTYYLCKTCDSADKPQRDRANHRLRRVEAKYGGEIEDLGSNNKIYRANHAKLNKSLFLSFILCGALACTANSMEKSFNRFGYNVLASSYFLSNIDDPKILSYFNATHKRIWHQIIDDNEELNALGHEIAEMEDGFEQDQLGFGMVIASDPQLPWGRNDDSNVTDAEWEESGIETNRYHTASMNSLNKLGGDFSKVQALIMNGDLTAYAHPWQWVLYKRLYDTNRKDTYPEALQMPVYPGLGNHDYQNNVGSCWGPWYSVLINQKNWCAKNAKMQIKKDLGAVNITNFDEGSLSYSWDVDHIHFVQLHNFPTYNSSKIDIEDSLEWLDADLSKAKSEGRLTVLNFHIKKITPELKKILRKYEILGLFVGHYHSLVGKMSKIETADGDRGLYYSGSASRNLFNYVYFAAHKMVVYSIDSSTGKPVIIKRYTQAFN